MKRERNNFFQESNFNQSYFQNGPIPQMEASSSFYMNQNMPGAISNELNSRLSRIERQVNKLEARINKLESSSNNISKSIDEYQDNTNMYMI